jgi:hypothetical protein
MKYDTACQRKENITLIRQFAINLADTKKQHFTVGLCADTT